MSEPDAPWTWKDTKRTVEIVTVILGLAILVGFVVWLQFGLDQIQF